jgi:vacuolar-type H+-ATPase subunit B/Vma2
MVYKQKSSKYWWFKFHFDGVLIREGAKTTNKRIAEQIESARQTQFAKGEVGINQRVKVPTLREFSGDFEKAIETQCAEKPRTIEFYKLRLRQLLASELGDRVLDTIDEEAVEKYRQKRSVTKSRHGSMLAPGSINRELATLGACSD